MRTDEWIRKASALLAESGIDSPTLEAQLLAAHAMNGSRSWILTHGESEIADSAEEFLHRRLSHEPLAYILGWREFFGRKFAVDHRVLIPRHETELLVELAIGFLSSTPAKVLDWGTGSGCIGITIALERTNCSVSAIDCSESALMVAEQNAQTLGAKVRFLITNGFASLDGETFDCIVANPPYVGEQDLLPIEIESFEPSVALYSDEGGTAIYRKIAEDAKEHLNVGGKMFLEIGAGQAEAVSAIFSQHGWRHISAHRDLSGIERVIELAMS